MLPSPPSPPAAPPAPGTVPALDPAALASVGVADIGLPIGVTLGRAGADALADVRAIHRQAMRPSLERTLGPWDDAAQGRWLAAHIDPLRTWLVRRGATVVGSVSWGVPAPTPEAAAHDHLELFQLLPEAQGQGLGGAVLAAIAAAADRLGRPLTLAVLRGSPAERLYVRHGFVLTHEDAHQRHFRRAPRPGAA